MHDTGTHWLLQKVYKRVCIDNCTNGEIVVEICDLLVERRVPKNFECTEGEDGDYAYSSFSRIGIRSFMYMSMHIAQHWV